MGIIVEIVQEKIGQAVTGEMLRDGNTLREDDAARIELALLCLLSEIGFGPFIGAAQPNHAVRNRIEQAHPDAEFLGADLIDIVEAAEHHALFGQAHLFSSYRAIRNFPLIVAGQVSMWQTDDLLGIMLFVS